MQVSVVNEPSAETPNAHYCSNRPPLAPSPLVKLPLGSVRAEGWLRHQLDLMVEGMTGRLTELSNFLGAENGWFGGAGRAGRSSLIGCAASTIWRC